MTRDWLTRVNALLHASLDPPRHELNDLDWKQGLSPDKAKLTAHLAALANHPGGGFLVFGISNQGEVTGISAEETTEVLGRLTNLGRQGLEPPVVLDHALENFRGGRILFVRVSESTVKPVHLRGKGVEHTFIRSGGSTRDASRQEVGNLMLNSRTPRWEELRATVLLNEVQLRAELDTEPIVRMLDRARPAEGDETLSWLAAERFIEREPSGGCYITNLGAIACSRRLGSTSSLGRRSLRAVQYTGKNKAETRLEREHDIGYAIGFAGMLDQVLAILPQSEVIEKALRIRRTLYPEIALRELLANALIHQDFGVTGAGPLVEIYADRVEISNPGGLLPSKQLDRLIGTQPESRNEMLAKSFRRFKICEERGSGLLKAGIEVEIYGLPPIRFDAGPSYFKVTLFAPRTFAQMTPAERLDACYQHAVLRHLSAEAMTNSTLRERMKMSEKQRSMVSVLIQEAIDLGLVKASDPNNKSRKFAEYKPWWA